MRHLSLYWIVMVSLGASVCSPAAYGQGTYGGGSGAEADPYRIATAEHMQEIGLHQEDWENTFLLTTDVDLGAFKGTDFNIIGTGPENPFTGLFDGGGNRILNFTYKSAQTDYLGLFGVLGQTGDRGEIIDLGLIDADVDAGNGFAVGALVGFVQNGTLERCFTQGGEVLSSNVEIGAVGALAGANDGTIRQCFAAANVLGFTGVGGLVGQNIEGLIENCYAHGNVLGNEFVGGLVGDQRQGALLLTSYAAGSVNGNLDVAGLVGINSGEIEDCYWDTLVSQQDRMCGQEDIGIGCDDENGESTARLQKEGTYTDWDFSTPIWVLDEAIEYPLFWWQENTAILFAFPLSPEQVTGDVLSDASGMAQVILDTAALEVTWAITLENLADGPDSVVTANFHGSANFGQAADVTLPIGVNSISLNDLTSTGPIPVTPEQVQEIQDGLWYVSIPTTAFGQGELRGQVVRAAAITVENVKVKAGKSRQTPTDAIRIDGKLYPSIQDAIVSDIINAEMLTVTLTNLDTDAVVLSDAFDPDVNPDLAASSQRYTYARPKGGEGAIRSLAIDFALNTFSLDAKKVFLTGLAFPFRIDIRYGLYFGKADLTTEDQALVNGKKPLPICLLAGVQDAMRIDKAKVKSKTSGDALRVKGGIASADLDLDLTQEDVTISWGDSFNETIAAGNFTNKNRRTFSYKKPKESPGAISKIDIDLDKCTFKISVKGAQNLEAAGSVFLGITIDPTFNQTDAIDL